ncbi:ABC transporter substrate-binding protein [Paenibacillus antri]|uniref:Lipoprotein n=1 Tax=Paenibacillus antri TaxID=2582848 RepID=A0A5R9GAC7_9BACL|nr:MetQ/NlpA family ABC transporter substrate-binding protein [Paenibacillus antri]TLS52711.1 ABC transporter substrate-binding protein [Paenibacillus antri]
MKRGFVVIASIALTVASALSGCGGGGARTSGEGEIALRIGATAVPHAEILNAARPLLSEQGIALEVVEFTDYIQPNVQVYEKQLDANFFQHQPYLDQFNQDHGMDLASVGSVHIEPFGAYSETWDSAEGLPDKAIVAIPNDPTNAGRALALLEKNGLLTLKEGAGVNAAVADIAANPKGLELKELEAAMLPRVMADVDLALINTNYALEAGFVPTEDALFLEDGDSPYVNVVAVRSDRIQDASIMALMEALRSDEVRDFILEQYEGSIIPVD